MEKVMLKKLVSRILLALAGVVTVYICILSIFAFRGITYLSDGTYLVSKFPIAAVAVGVTLLLVSALLLKMKKTKMRMLVATLSFLAVVSLVGNSLVYASTPKGNQALEAGVDAALIDEHVAHYGHVFMAGAAKGDISPSANLMPMPLLSVFKFDRVVDRVYARVLAMSNGVQQSLFITLDMTLVPDAEATLDFLSDKTGIPKRNIFISATHTHGVTPVSLIDYVNPVDQMKVDDWYEQIKTTLLATVREAQLSMSPARYGYGTGQSNVNVNRDVLDGDKAVLGSNFDRPSDKTIKIVRFEDLSGNLIALIVNYAVHGVVLNGLMDGLRTPMSGDLPGKTSEKLEAKLDGAVVLWSSGPAGDQNPRLMTQYGGPVEEGKPTQRNLGVAGYNVLEYLSDEHVRDILKAIELIRANRTNPNFYSSETISHVKSKDNEDISIPYTLRLFVIGDIAFQGISAEIVTSIGRKIVDTSPYEDTILVTLANGYQGYVADDWEYEHDAFEVDNSAAAKGQAQKEFLKDFEEMFQAAP
jgi:hypothetical protein